MPTRLSRLLCAWRLVVLSLLPCWLLLLLAVGMLAARWDGESARHLGFPDDGTSMVRSEGPPHGDGDEATLRPRTRCPILEPESSAAPG